MTDRRSLPPAAHVLRLSPEEARQARETPTEVHNRGLRQWCVGMIRDRIDALQSKPVRTAAEQADLSMLREKLEQATG